MNRQIVFGVSLLLGACVGGCKDSGHPDKPVVKLGLDQRVSVVQAQSTFKFSSGFLAGAPALEQITVPHELIYEDSTLKLHIKDAGGQSSLATHINNTVRLEASEPESTVKNFGVHLLPDYTPLRPALQRAKELRDELLAQGFVLNERTWMSRFRAISSGAPASLDAFEDLEPSFLNSNFFVQEATLFDMSKGKLRIEVSLVNARRRWGSRTDSNDSTLDRPEVRAAREASSMSREALLAEPSYALSLQLGPTDEWRKQRMK